MRSLGDFWVYCVWFVMPRQQIWLCVLISDFSRTRFLVCECMPSVAMTRSNSCVFSFWSVSVTFWFCCVMFLSW